MKLRTGGIVWREVDGEIIILDLAASTYFTTNRTGAVLLRLLADERSHDDLVAVLVAEFGISSGRANADVAEFTRVLSERKLLESEIPEPAGE